jgi:hypothetical protein
MENKKILFFGKYEGCIGTINKRVIARDETD